MRNREHPETISVQHAYVSLYLSNGKSISVVSATTRVGFYRTGFDCREENIIDNKTIIRSPAWRKTREIGESVLNFFTDELRAFRTVPTTTADRVHQTNAETEFRTCGVVLSKHIFQAYNIHTQTRIVKSEVAYDENKTEKLRCVCGSNDKSVLKPRRLCQ